MSNQKTMSFSVPAILGVSLLIAGGVAPTRAQLYGLPYGASVGGTVFSEDPQVTQQYSNGDINGSGPLTFGAVGSASVLGANANSSVYIPSNSVTLFAETSTPEGGPVGAATAAASAAMWDTLTFKGGLPSEIGLFILTETSLSNSIFAYGNGSVGIYNARVGGDQVAQASFSLPADTTGSVKTFVYFPLDASLQIVESVSVFASGSQTYPSAQITVDPIWSFMLPAGVTISSASGATYTTSSVPEPTMLTLLGIGLAGLGLASRSKASCMAREISLHH